MTTKFERVAANKLNVDLTYQRDPYERITVLKSYASKFDEDLLGVPIVSKRIDASLWLIDGAGRKVIVSELINPPQPAYPLMCQILSGLSLEEEAQMHIDLQRFRKKQSPFDLFRAQLATGEKEANAIARLLEQADMGLREMPSPAVFRRLYRAQVLAATLRTTKPWREQKIGRRRVPAVAYQAVALIHKFMSPFDPDRLHNIIKDYEPASLIKRVKLDAAATLHPDFSGVRVAERIVFHYNHRLRGNHKLPIKRLRQLYEVPWDVAIKGRWQRNEFIEEEEKKTA
jgi:hypothetical protein